MFGWFKRLFRRKRVNSARHRFKRGTVARIRRGFVSRKRRR